MSLATASQILAMYPTLREGIFPKPYFQGRYSNGPVWVEYLASKLRLTSNPDTNFAFGGSTTDFKGTPPGLLAQIKSFKATTCPPTRTLSISSGLVPMITLVVLLTLRRQSII